MLHVGASIAHAQDMSLEDVIKSKGAVKHDGRRGRWDSWSYDRRENGRDWLKSMQLSCRRDMGNDTWTELDGVALVFSNYLSMCWPVCALDVAMCSFLAYSLFVNMLDTELHQLVF